MEIYTLHKFIPTIFTSLKSISINQTNATLCIILCRSGMAALLTQLRKGFAHLFTKLPILEGTARYAGLLLAPAEGFGLRPRLFLPFGPKKSLLCSPFLHLH